MIEIEGLSKTYGPRSRTVTALRDVSLSIGPGVWGVVGPNGAGKTTLLGAILGFLHPSDGSVSLDGTTPRRYLRRQGASYLPERFRLPGGWTVRSALRGLARLEGHGPGAASARVNTAITRLGLDDHADSPIGTLSRGLTQRVGLAQALLADRRLVVLDEPTEGLDPLWRVRFREMVDDLRDGRTVLLASHDLGEVERLADRVIVLDDGRVTELMDARQPPGGALRFRLHIDGSDDVLRTAFPAAEGADGAFVVEVIDAAELSHRLAALLEAGAVVRAVIPLTEDLETRVRQRLEGS